MSLIVGRSNLNSLPSGAACVPRPTPLGQATPERRRGCPATMKSGLQEIRELIAFSVGKSRPDDCLMLGCSECCPLFEYTTHGITRNQQFFIRRNNENRCARSSPFFQSFRSPGLL